MAMFVCESCGCLENTATSNWWWRYKNKEMYGQDYINGNGYCSACLPVRTTDGRVTEFAGMWHRRFRRDMWNGISKVENRIGRVGNDLLEYQKRLEIDPPWITVAKSFTFVPWSTRMYGHTVYIIDREPTKEFVGYVLSIERNMDMENTVPHKGIEVDVDTKVTERIIYTLAGVFVCSYSQYNDPKGFFRRILMPLDLDPTTFKEGLDGITYGRTKNGADWYVWNLNRETILKMDEHSKEDAEYILSSERKL